MNLLMDAWIPVRPQASGVTRQISLQALLCGSERWELALPRDDMELATLQLLICLVQVLLPPANKKQWAERITKPIPEDTWSVVARDYQDWFQLDHPDYPFMQVKDVAAKDPTPMDKLLAGLNSSTNSRFVNEPDLANGLCFGCVAIALYNLANNAPSFGGGFKFGIRGSCPVSTFAQGTDLRSTLWLNVLSEESLDAYLPEWKAQATQPPTWVEPIKDKTTIPAYKIGLLRGLLWQPGHIVLSPPEKSGQCSCCGHEANKLFTSFNKAKFNYTIDGIWEHPHSPQVLNLKQGNTEVRYVGFTQSIPAWTQLSRYVVKRELGKGEQGQKPAMVIQQLQSYRPNKSDKFELLIGGYRNNQAAIIERRHEVLTLSQGWEANGKVIHELVAHGLKYKTALRESLRICVDGFKKNNQKFKGTRLKLQEVGDAQFYRRSEHLMIKALADIDFSNTSLTFAMLDAGLKQICESIFLELTTPYEHDPELFRTLAIARRSLQKHLKEIRSHSLEEDAA